MWVVPPKRSRRRSWRSELSLKAKSKTVPNCDHCTRTGSCTTCACRVKNDAQRCNTCLVTCRHRRRHRAPPTNGTKPIFGIPVPRRSTHAVRMARPGYRWSQFNKQARQRGVVVGIMRHEHAALIDQPCIYCGSRPSAARRIGVDRLDSKRGYELRNCVPATLYVRTVSTVSTK